jgi:hypothetical protein
VRLWTGLDEKAYFFVTGLAAKLGVSHSKALAYIVQRTMEDLENLKRSKKNESTKRSRKDRP